MPITDEQLEALTFEEALELANRLSEVLSQKGMRMVEEAGALQHRTLEMLRTVSNEISSTETDEADDDSFGPRLPWDEDLPDSALTYSRLIERVIYQQLHQLGGLASTVDLERAVMSRVRDADAEDVRTAVSRLCATSVMSEANGEVRLVEGTSGQRAAIRSWILSRLSAEAGLTERQLVALTLAGNGPLIRPALQSLLLNDNVTFIHGSGQDHYYLWPIRSGDVDFSLYASGTPILTPFESWVLLLIDWQDTAPTLEDVQRRANPRVWTPETIEATINRLIELGVLVQREGALYRVPFVARPESPLMQDLEDSLIDPPSPAPLSALDQLLGDDE